VVEGEILKATYRLIGSLNHGNTKELNAVKKYIFNSNAVHPNGMKI